MEKSNWRVKTLKLHAISQKIGVDLSYFLPRVTWIGGRYFATTLIALLLSAAFAQLTAKESFGQYQYVLSVVSLLSIFSLPGLNTAAIRAVVEGDEQSVKHSAQHSFMTSLLATVVLVGMGIYKHAHSEQTLGLALGLAGLLLPFFYATNSWYVYYEAKLNFHTPTLRLIAANLVLLIVMVIGLKIRLNLVGLVLIYYGLNAIMNFLFFWEGSRRVKSKLGESKLDLRYAIRCSIQKFTITFGENIQAIAVSALFGFANLAIYQVAQSFVNVFNGLTAALSATYFPLILKYRQLNHPLILVQNLALGVVFWVIYLGAIKFLFTPLYGFKYQEATELAYRLSLIILVTPLRLYLINYFSARDRNHIIITTNLVASAIALGLFFMSKSMGFYQAAVIYLYVLNYLMMLPLLGIYLTIAFKKKSKA